MWALPRFFELGAAASPDHIGDFFSPGKRFSEGAFFFARMQQPKQRSAQTFDEIFIFLPPPLTGADAVSNNRQDPGARRPFSSIIPQTLSPSYWDERCAIATCIDEACQCMLLGIQPHVNQPACRVHCVFFCMHLCLRFKKRWKGSGLEKETWSQNLTW